MSRAGLRVILIIATVLCILAGSYAHLRYERRSYDEASEVLYDAEHLIEVEPFTSVDVRLPIGTVILLSNSGTYMIEYSGPDEFYPECTVQDKVLHITSPGDVMSLSELGEDPPQYVIHVSGSGLLSARMRVDSGELQIGRVQCREADLSCGTGTLDCSGCSLQKAHLDVEIGRIQLHSPEFEQLDISMETGDVEITLDSLPKDKAIRLTSDLGMISVNGEEQKKSSVVLSETGTGTAMDGDYLDAHVDVGNIDLFYYGEEE